MICKICGKDFKSPNHIKKKHDITSKEYYDKYIKLENECYCKICGKPTAFNGLKLGYKTYCSVKCAQNDIDIRQKALNTTRINLKNKYGVTNVQQIPSVKEKTKTTCKERYGNEYAVASKEVKAKISKIQKSKDREYEDLTKLHTVCCIYGSGWYQKRKEIGIDIVMKGRYAYIKNSDIQKIINYQHSELRKSSKEYELAKFIQSIYKGRILRNKKKAIPPYEIDIYLPEIKLAIEYNGMYWHSFEKGCPKDYHLTKSILCKNNEIRLIHIYGFEDFEQQCKLLKSLIVDNVDLYNKKDCNKNSLIITKEKPEIIFKDSTHTIYGVGKLY